MRSRCPSYVLHSRDDACTICLDVHPPGERAVIKLNLLFPLGALAALAIGNAGAQPAPVAKEQTHTISATVEKIDAQKRLIELRKGEERQTIEVPAEVRNFDKIKVGDEVAVTYYEGL